MHAHRVRARSLTYPFAVCLMAKMWMVFVNLVSIGWCKGAMLLLSSAQHRLRFFFLFTHSGKELAVRLTIDRILIVLHSLIKSHKVFSVEMYECAQHTNENIVITPIYFLCNALSILSRRRCIVSSMMRFNWMPKRIWCNSHCIFGLLHRMSILQIYAAVMYHCRCKVNISFREWGAFVCL